MATVILPSAQEIEKWKPSFFEEFVGNRSLIKCLKDGIRVHGRLPNTFVRGPSRSGKTAAIKLFIKSLFCVQRDPTTLNPCGSCDTCLQNVEDHGHYGLFAEFDDGAPSREIPLHYVPIDCPKIPEAKLRDVLQELRDFEGIRIVYLDEVHRLVERKMDHMLLKSLEERRFLWMASSATTAGLEQMFLNRFSKRIRTSLPESDKLAEFLALRCLVWGIEWKEPETIVRLVERANQVPGLALQVLAAAAATPERELTRELVEDHDFLQEE